LSSPYFTSGSNNSLMARPHKKPPVRETITYPKVTVTDDTDSCRNPALPCEHVLLCGHIVTTVLPNEPCAPNCHHVADGGAALDIQQRNGKAPRTSNGNQVSEKDFYCDACVETRLETSIGMDLSSTAAEELRAKLRKDDVTHRKDAMFRKCYIALKFTSVPCHSEGTMSSRYVPREEHHAFDTAVPQSGENMFEDIDPRALDAKENGDKTQTELAYIFEDLYIPPDYLQSRTPRTAVETSDTSVRNAPKSTAEHANNDQPAGQSKTSRKRKSRPIVEEDEDEDAQALFEAPKRRRLLDDKDHGEIVEQKAKRKRVTPVTRGSARKQTKKT
jgi:hypothetical protein